MSVFDLEDVLRPAVGGGLQLSSSATILARLGIDVRKAAIPLRSVRSRSVDGTQLLSLDVSKAMGRWGLLGNVGGADGAFAIMRETLQEMLAAPLPTDTLKLGRKLVGTRQLSSGGVSCSFDDGSEEEFDLVVGCDGISSVVKRRRSPTRRSRSTRASRWPSQSHPVARAPAGLRVSSTSC